MIQSHHRLAILLHEGIQGNRGKTGLALLRYTESEVVAVIDRQSSGASLTDLTGILRPAPIVASVTDALAYKPNVLVLGTAPTGGALPNEWRQEIKQAIAAGLSISNGLHTPLASDPDFQPLQPDQWIWDMRQEPPNLPIGTGKARSLSCLRVLTVGTDMAIGKMSTSLQLHQASLKRELRSKFIATGQAGMMIAGDGVALDAVRVDFASGAVEQIVMRYGNDHDILQIEGQGSLLNPSSSATLPLIRGSQPTHLILVHRAGQTHLSRIPEIPIPPLPEVVQLYEAVAKAGGAFTSVPVAAIALNTHHLDEPAARTAISQVETETNLPCTDPVRFGADKLLQEVLGVRNVGYEVQS
ncbi:DUF1611 domain-containing protein [Phormidium sp. CLA17]|uniref:DUF1611 domain-containing protein n=1 Tax=Leptolyngbya sp. Cla-17 TaxID=2803751 RepID=UPI0014922460|nr:DUF1611 domain-containing protein [Leptolyngbya sp. Cla-17]MBM0740187.1 DUF1611 domain-containing protein [Leptolyngbya sp. Cla-17]